MLNVYFASKLRHASKWREIRDQLKTKIRVTSSWIDDPNIGREGTVSKQVLRDAWNSNVQDVGLYTNVLVVYADHDDQLRGALIEAGAALGLGIRVVACGFGIDDPTDRNFGSWQFHPLVTRCVYLTEAITHLEKLSEKIDFTSGPLID